MIQSMIGKNCYGAYVLRDPKGETAVLGVEASDVISMLKNYPIGIGTGNFAKGPMRCWPLGTDDRVYKSLKDDNRLVG